MRATSAPDCPSGPSRVVLLAFVPLLSGAVVWNALVGDLPWWRWITLALLGLGVWTLVEYSVHRWLFHIVPASAWLLRRQQHLAHHAAPEAPQYFVIPLWLSLPVAGLVWSLIRLLLGSWREAALPLAGAVAGYVAYELVHYEIHLGRGRGRLMRFWRRHHLYHHYGDERRCFGFTTSLWDLVFGTAAPRREQRAGRPAHPPP